MKEQDWNLGRFIRVRARSDGTHRVFMSVPAKLRPTDWPPSIKLPEMHSRRGSLTDPLFYDRVAKDAARLNATLDLRRDLEGTLARHSEGTLVQLADIVRETSRYRGVSESRRYRYNRSLNTILLWSAGRQHPKFTTIFKRQIEEMLRAFENRPAVRLELRIMWNILCNEAIDAGWRTDNPVKRVPWRRLKPATINTWSEEHVDRFHEVACKLGQPGLGALIKVQFFIGQRLKDTRLCQYDLNYDGAGIGVRQFKTDEVVGVPLPQKLRDLIESVRLPGSPYLFNEWRSGQPFTECSIKYHFNAVRQHALQEGDRLLLIRALRHSAVCDMAKLGMSTILIASITGHKFKTVETILERYAIDRRGFAREAAITRHVAKGGSKDDFAPASEPIGRDWKGRTLERPIFVYPWNKRLQAA